MVFFFFGNQNAWQKEKTATDLALIFELSHQPLICHFGVSRVPSDQLPSDVVVFFHWQQSQQGFCRIINKRLDVACFSIVPGMACCRSNCGPFKLSLF